MAPWDIQYAIEKAQEQGNNKIIIIFTHKNEKLTVFKELIHVYSFLLNK